MQTNFGRPIEPCCDCVDGRCTMNCSRPMRQDEPINSPLGYDDICRLSRSFNETARLDTPQDYRINEWLKTQIAERKQSSQV